MAQHGRENCHCNEGGKGGREDDKPRVLHRHQSSDQKCFVPNLGKDDHREGEDEGVQWLDERGGIAGEHGNGRCKGSKNCKRVALGGCGRNRMWKVMRFIREISRFLG